MKWHWYLQDERHISILCILLSVQVVGKSLQPVPRAATVYSKCPIRPKYSASAQTRSDSNHYTFRIDLCWRRSESLSLVRTACLTRRGSSNAQPAT
jgi:hypothetical protein